MVAAELLELLRRERLLAIVRGGDPERVPAVLETLADGGIALAEIALSDPEAIDALAAAAQVVGGRIVLGAGTVLRAEQVDAARDAGAAFLVTPGAAPGVAAAAAAAGLPLLPGAATASEVLAASAGEGVAAVKLFPARQLGGPGYVAALRGPFPEIPLVPVGGVGADEAAAYLRAGAVAVGCGGPLLGDAPAGGDLTALAARVRAFRAALAA